MSEEPKHTPGPWTIEADPYHYDTLSTVVGGAHIRPAKDGRFTLPRELIVQVGGESSVEAQEANTRIIAAAPDMLAALKALSYQLHCMNWTGHLIENCDAAIAKAEGRAE